MFNKHPYRRGDIAVDLALEFVLASYTMLLFYQKKLKSTQKMLAEIKIETTLKKNAMDRLIMVSDLYFIGFVRFSSSTSDYAPTVRKFL